MENIFSLALPKATTMKNIFSLIVTTVALLGCIGLTTSKNNGDQPGITAVTTLKGSTADSSINPGHLFTLSDAEKILGEPARLTESASKIKDDVATFSSAYGANSKDPKTGKTGNIYFMFEQYKKVAAAKKVYESIRKSNETHEGVRVLHDMGDEAYFHSDGQNFYFILVRKGPNMFRMKVNKVTSTTSGDQFKQVAKKITAEL